MTLGAPVAAALDLGSNSVHLLVSVIAGHRLRPIADESVFLGLGAAVDARAHLGAEDRAALVVSLDRYATTARRLGASAIVLLGTEPIRRAADASRIVAEVGRGTDLPLFVLSHEEEAYLTFIGVSGGWPVEHETLVVDIGGGSSEFCAVHPDGPVRAAGLRIGSNGLTRRFATTDPVDEAAFGAMAAAADASLVGAIPAEPAEVVIVGGTASNLLKVTADGNRDPILTSTRLEEATANVRSAPAAEITTRFAVNPKLGPLLAAGAVIVGALMRRYGVDRLRVSEASLREGAILAVDHAGPAWRDRLPSLVHGWKA
jgi:exopolyphosphatase / guanosine-5'-triphosphate,3'-diphosphate pyrophosphatase